MLRNQVRNHIEYELQYGKQRELYHYNCAQAILHGSNDYYNIGLDPKALKMIIAFGGGMCTENTCGILTGGIAAIGVLFAEDMPTQNLKLKEVTRLWIQRFESEFQNTNCSLIKSLHLKNDEGCTNLILQSANILQEVIEKHKKYIAFK